MGIFPDRLYGFSWGCYFFEVLATLFLPQPSIGQLGNDSRTCFQPSHFAYTSVTWHTALLLLLWEITEDWTTVTFDAVPDLFVS